MTGPEVEQHAAMLRERLGGLPSGIAHRAGFLLLRAWEKHAKALAFVREPHGDLVELAEAVRQALDLLASLSPEPASRRLQEILQAMKSGYTLRADLENKAIYELVKGGIIERKKVYGASVTRLVAGGWIERDPTVKLETYRVCSPVSQVPVYEIGKDGPVDWINATNQNGGTS